MLTPPLHVMVGKSALRRDSKLLRCHACTIQLAGGSFLWVDKELVVASPELTFLQLANELPFAKLVQLGYELCGTYGLRNRLPMAVNFVNCDSMQIDLQIDSHDQRVPTALEPALTAPAQAAQVSDGFFKRQPLTSTAKLAAYLDRMSAMNGSKKAARALRYIVDGSASPMETALAMLLTMPYAQGGYHLPLPQMNVRVSLGAKASEMTKKRYFVCDLFWPDYDLACEYDSDQHHTGSKRIASDSHRRNLLQTVGILMITVAREQIKNVREFNAIARQLAHALDKRLQYREPQFCRKHRELRSLIFRDF
jgi:hypothetical protein